MLSIDQWQAGGAGIEWQSIGQLTGITTKGTAIIPAVVDSTTNAVGLLALKNRGGSISSPQASNVDLTGLLTDGNRETFWRVERERRPDGTSMIIDLGAILPINRIRIQGDDETYLRAYELFVHDGDPATLREDRPVAFINQVSSNLEQDTPTIDAQIPLQFVRFIRLISRSSQEFAIEDVEVFGDGYAPTGSFTSEIINLGAAANFGVISLKTQIDSLTDIVLETRTGIVPDPKIYYRKTEIFQGEERAEEAILPIGQAEAEDTYRSLRVADRGSIKDNIAFGLKEDQINNQLIKKCLIDSQLQEFVKVLDNGIETKIGDRGLAVSGGELQRIAIARALYSEPDLIIFDEATNALDKNTEQKIIKLIHNLSKKITIILITHDIKNINYCSKIFKINEKKIEQIEKNLN